jgi:hypothetical protein
MKWYDLTGWVLDRVESFPKNQRFIFGQRLANHMVDVMEVLVEASYTRDKTGLLNTANRQMEVLRWLLRLCHARQLLTQRQYLHASGLLVECGRMCGGWLRSRGSPEAGAAPPSA